MNECYLAACLISSRWFMILAGGRLASSSRFMKSMYGAT